MEPFQQTVWQYYHGHGRSMPWRDSPSFYHVLVSELMLQQTQVSRVIPKFTAFIQQFPTIEALAAASLGDVVAAWVGLGYNRRAKYLHAASRQIAAAGPPHDVAGLVTLPGVGKNTAAAIMNYAYEVATPFVETNIRSVYLATFFSGKSGVSDADILQRVRQTMDYDHPREWFWALMDYGSYLKANGESHLSRSRHYSRQKPLQGSVRQMRGWIIARLAEGATGRAKLEQLYGADERFETALQALKTEGMVMEDRGTLYLTK